MIDLDRLRIEVEINKDSVVVDVERLEGIPSAAVSFSCSALVTLPSDANVEEIIEVRDLIRRLGVLPIDKEVLLRRTGLSIVEEE